jgi:hypothetical protein
VRVTFDTHDKLLEETETVKQHLHRQPLPTTLSSIMCVKDAEQIDQEEFESLDNNNKKPGPLHCEVLRTQMEKWEKESPLMSSTAQISPERPCPVRIPIP